MTPWGLVNCKVFGPQGPSLTNRVSELFTHGSVGGVGRKPGPYPAADGLRPPLNPIVRPTTAMNTHALAKAAFCASLAILLSGCNNGP
jgi:hypothetical protein